ncbi:MAG TPA: glutathione S-transferase family protein [Gammaproteobacteria bacterium]|nr:glutathione S-transferase family protein [Gammaproteobacteria bacterium]
MYRLYWEACSGAILPQVMFEEMSVPYERIPVDMAAGEHQTAEYLAVNPTGQVPALELPDGTVIGESAAMALVLGERHPEPGLVPGMEDAARPVFLRWLLFMAASVYMTFVRVNHPERFVTDHSCVESAHQAALDSINKQFQVLDSAISGDPWFMPAGYSALDIYATMLADWHPDRGHLFAHNPSLARLCLAVEGRPAYAEVIAQHRT